MRRDKPLLSPKSPQLKLHLKSPPPLTPHKQTSPITSHRSISKRHISSAKNIGNRITIWLPNATLYSFFHPLNRIDKLGKYYEFKLQVDDRNLEKRAQKGEKVWIISNIDAFVEVYMQLTDEVKLECAKWFVICGAVNSKEMEQQFNQLYSPIKFVFLPSISSVCNTLLEYTSTPISYPLRQIYDLSLNCSANNLCSQQTLIEQVQNAKLDCMYIINDAKQWIQFSTKINSLFVPYFITGCQKLLKTGHIVINRLNCANINNQINHDQVPHVSEYGNSNTFIEKPKIIYICFGFVKNLKNLQGFQQYEQQFRSKLSIPRQLEKLNTQNQIYMRKIIEKLLIPKDCKCIFMDPIPRSPLPQLQTMRYKFPPQYFTFPIKLYLASPNSYRLKFNTRTRSCNTVCISTTTPLQDQIQKIKSYIQSKQKMFILFKEHQDLFKKMHIFLYSREDQKGRDKNKHCISQMLEKCQVKVGVIEDIGYIVEVQKITVVYGCFSFDQIRAMAKFYNVFLVPVSKESEDVATFNQLSQCKHFLEKSMQSYNQLCSQPINPPLQIQIHILYEQETQLPQIFQSIQIPEHQLKTHYIPSFHTELANFRENSKHIVISPMDIFSEALEKQIRQFQWRYNTISIDIYLQYGNQFIFRNKEGSYKFIKAKELQEKITMNQGLGKIVKKTADGNKDGVKNKAIDNKEEAGWNLQVLQYKKKGFEQVEQIEGSVEAKMQLNNLAIEQSVVELYSNEQKGRGITEISQNKINKKQSRKEQQQVDRQNSLIELLSESMISNKNGSKIKDIESFHNNKSSSLIGQQTVKLIQQSNRLGPKIRSNKIIKQNSEYELSINFKDSKQQSGSMVQGQYANKRVEIQQNRQANNKKKLKQKISYIKQYKQPKRSQIDVLLHSNQQIDQLNNIKSNLTTHQQQIYKLYIFIHRSVPHYSLCRRQQKQYHLLLYTRIEQIIMFARYLKCEQKIVVIANQQSQKIYNGIIGKSGVDAKKLKVIFIRDLSQGFIRGQVDMILGQFKLLELGQKKLGIKNFKALVIYSAQNQRAQKAIKIIKKVFGVQIKILFIKQKQYEEMISNQKFMFKLCNNIQIYKIGLNNLRNHQISITSIRGLFILAMHPDLKAFQFQYSQLSFSLEAYIARFLYGAGEKNYVNAQKTLKVGDSLRKKVQGMKSQKNLFRHGQSQLSLMRQNSERRISQTPRRSSITKSSSIFLRSSTTVSIIASLQLRQYCPSRLSFSHEQQLLSEMFISYSQSKFVVAVITQKQFDTFELFQSPHFYQVSKQIVWIIETKIEGKQVFMGKNIVFVTCDNLREVVQSIVKQYQVKIYFEDLCIQSKFDGVQNGRYGQLKTKQNKSDYSRTLQVLVIPKLTQIEDKKIDQANSRNRIIVTLGVKNKKKCMRNVIQFASTSSIKDFCETLIKKFKTKAQIQPIQSFGSMILVPSQHLQKINKVLQTLGKNNVIVKGYDIQNLASVVCFNVFRTLLLIDKQNEFKCLKKCTYALQLDKNFEKTSKIIGSTLI